MMKQKAEEQSPLQIELVAEFDAPPAEVFHWMTYRLPEWFAQIDEVAYDNAASLHDEGAVAKGAATGGAVAGGIVGEGSVRTCGMGKNAVVEVMTEFVPGVSYRYKTDADRTTLKMPIRNHEGSIHVTPGADDDTSVVTWKQFYVPPRGPLGRFIRWNMREKMMRPGLVKLSKQLGGSVRS